jgi:hypothetical protein
MFVILILMKKFWFFLLFLIFILFPFPTFAAHVCNQGCTGAANITCSETTGTLSYNQGSCNAGLACYSGAGNVCRNPYCPTATNCSCPTFTIQGYKQPNQSPFSGQTISLDGGSPTTAQPYSFTNVAANTIHRVSASSPAGSSVGYTLCYNNTNCHSNTPVSSNSVYVCSNLAINGSTNYADLWWHYAPQIAKCSNISGPTSILLGDTVTYSANYNNDVSNLTGVGMFYTTDSSNCSSKTEIPNPTPAFSGPGSYSFSWQPSAIGTYFVYCRATSNYNGSNVYAIGYQPCVGSPPEYLVNGVASNQTYISNIQVSNPGPWYKLKDASLNKIGDHNIAMVQNINPFDSDDNNTRVVIITSSGSNAGVLLSTNNYNPGPSYNPIPDNTTPFDNTNNRHISSYGTIYQPMLDNFYQYLKSRKQIEEKTDISQIDKNGIYFIKTDGLTISAQPPNYNFVLIVRNSTNTDLGSITININNFNTNNKSIMILAKDITFSSSVTAASGIFIATNQFTYQSSNGLKILGNLISKNAVTLQLRSDNTRPSLFIVFKPQMYLDLLSYLSISKYDWQQLQ